MQCGYISLGSVLFAMALLEDVSGVRRPEYMSRARIALEHNQEPEEVPLTSTKPPPLDVHRGLMTSARCCKVGERVAKEGLYCSYDIHAISRTPNYIHRHKLKLYNQDSSKTQVREFKSLTLRIAKCFNYKDMFEKCCNYRSSFIVSMRRCRNLKGGDKRQCRLKTRKTFGF